MPRSSEFTPRYISRWLANTGAAPTFTSRKLLARIYPLRCSNIPRVIDLDAGEAKTAHDEESSVTGRDVTCRMGFSAYREGCNIDPSRVRAELPFHRARDVIGPVPVGWWRC